VVPTIGDVIDFKNAVQATLPKQNIFFHLGAGPTSWKGVSGTDSIGIWIGPEGGWTDEEAAIAHEQGFQIASLGSLALRAETAAVVGSYMAIHGRGV
jgi:16S rRNA (uracil1498-N3)-methyltransferase